MSNPKLQRRIEEMKDANAELARRTAALAEQNDRLAAQLGDRFATDASGKRFSYQRPVLTSIRKAL